MPEPRNLTVQGARVHNLLDISVTIPKNRLTVITGKSGSGKSSLAFDTIYAEGQRRYVESLSAYARQFLEQMPKPDVDHIEGLSPAIAIEQRTVSRNPRSTVATITEIYDYLRVLYARTGIAHCPACGRPVSASTIQQMVDSIMAMPDGTRFMILAPLPRTHAADLPAQLKILRRQGFVRLRIDGVVTDIADASDQSAPEPIDLDVVIDRLIRKPGIEQRLADSLQTALQLTGGKVTAARIDGPETMYNERLRCPDCDISLPEIEPRLFSFNSPAGACPACDGLGTRVEFDPTLIVPDHNLSIADGALAPWGSADTFYIKHVAGSLAAHYGFSLATPYKKLPGAIRRMLLHGSDGEPVKMIFSSEKRTHTVTRPYAGLLAMLNRRYHRTGSDKVREELSRYMRSMPCPQCKGARLRPESLGITISDCTIHQLTTMDVETARQFLATYRPEGNRAVVAAPLLQEIDKRLATLSQLGLGYLTLDRLGGSLSGGEAHRIRLATQLGTRLSGVLYVLDEPSVGLHARDTLRLLGTLKQLRDIGNTVIVVEHDQQTIGAADYCIDLGPGAGAAGGRVVASGTPQQLMRTKKSLTGRYLAGDLGIALPPSRRTPGRRRLQISGAREHNLRHVTATIPLGLLVCVTGVSGSGKSSLITDTLYPALSNRLHRTTYPVGTHTRISGIQHVDKVISIDQAPIGRTPRSNAATFTGLFTTVRELFAQLPESRARGYQPGRFSFNVKGGRCEACQGDGVVRIEMHFLPDLYVTCDVCGGRRYNRETLEITYKGRTITDVLNLPVSEALSFFDAVPALREKLQVLQEVGLGYLPLGQSATTLSGGEAQRVKLARELSRRSEGHTVYILDEPTTGLHIDDIRHLLDVLHALIERGNTVIIIEHNLDVIASADHVIDLGPEAGDAGGQIVCHGTPETVAACGESHTGRHLRPLVDHTGCQAT